MVHYLYDGVLTEHESDCIHDFLQSYPYAIEVSKYPPHEIFQSLKKQDSWHTDDFGYTTKRTGTLYALCQKHSIERDEAGRPIDKGGFLFVNNHDDHLILIKYADQTGTLISSQPFRSAF